MSAHWDQVPQTLGPEKECMPTNMKAHVSLHMPTRMPTHMPPHMPTHMSTHMSAHVSTHTSIYMFVRARAGACARTCTSKHMPPHMSARVSMDTCKSHRRETSTRKATCQQVFHRVCHCAWHRTWVIDMWSHMSFTHLRNPGDKKRVCAVTHANTRRKHVSTHANMHATCVPTQHVDTRYTPAITHGDRTWEHVRRCTPANPGDAVTRNECAPVTCNASWMLL